MSRLAKLNALAASMVAGTLGAGLAHAAGNPFAATDLAGGYQQLAEADAATPAAGAVGKPAEGSCGAGHSEEKAKEGNCGGSANADGQTKPQGEEKAADKPADAPADKVQEGKCGEGRCGAGMGM